MTPETLDVSASLAIQSVDTTIATTTVCNHGPQLTAIAVASCLIAGLFLWLIFFKRKSDEDDPYRTKCPATSTDGTSRVCPRILKRDLYYIVTILLVIIIFVFTHLYVGNDDAMNYFSFASTVASIVLSVVAIMMTIFSDSKNENTKAMINESIQTLRKATEEVQIHSKDMSTQSSDQKEVFEQILKKSEEILDRTKKLQEDIDKIQHRDFSDHPDPQFKSQEFETVPDEDEEVCV